MRSASSRGIWWIERGDIEIKQEGQTWKRCNYFTNCMKTFKEAARDNESTQKAYSFVKGLPPISYLDIGSAMACKHWKW